jgi:hypothetical protein
VAESPTLVFCAPAQFDRQRNQIQGIPNSRTQQDRVDSEVKAGLFSQPREESSIPLLTLPFAAKKDSCAYWDGGATSLYPSCGTAPYTPPRYFW